MIENVDYEENFDYDNDGLFTYVGSNLSSMIVNISIVWPWVVDLTHRSMQILGDERKFQNQCISFVTQKNSTQREAHTGSSSLSITIMWLFHLIIGFLNYKHGISD